MPETASPILPPISQDRPLVWQSGAAVTQAGLLQRALELAETLPDRDHVVDACASRYGFLTVLLAALLRGQRIVLPGDRSPRMAAQLAADFPGIYCLSDSGIPLQDIETYRVSLELPARDFTGTTPRVDLGAAEIVVFTSGSTGTPMPHRKSPALLAKTGQLIADRFDLSASAILATVPPQHMYGLETSVALPLWANASVHSAKPLYPADIAAALAELPAPRILVTTPIHMNALVTAKTALPPLQKVISATAPLTPELAATVEADYDTAVFEIFGFSEAGTVATRRTLAGPRWQTCDGLVLRQDQSGCLVDAPHFPAPVPVNDVIEVLSPETFELRGRPTDSINIAGKRASLSGLNSILIGLEGVEDGAFFLADQEQDKVTRLVAFVVSKTLSSEDIRNALRQEVDPAFLPRQVYLVPELPRSQTGKLPRAALAALAERMKAAKP